MTEHVHGKRWVEEFRAELAADHHALLDARLQRQDTVWSFDRALAATRRFYVERITGYATCGSVTAAEAAELLGLVEGLGVG